MEEKNIQTPEVIAESVGETGKPGKKGKKPLLFLGIGIVVVMVLLVTLLGGKKTLNMKDYVSVNFSGLDEKGRAVLVVDYDKMAQDLPQKKGSAKKDSLTAMLGDWATGLGQRALIESAVRCSLDNTNDLSNGDKVKVEIQVDQDQCKYLGIKVKDKPLTFKVEGLTEVEPFDAFADISVVFDGVSPAATAKIVNNSTDEACMSYDYSLDQSSGLANGDTVTVSIEEYSIDDVGERTGKVPAEMEKQFTVEGVAQYASQLSQLSDTALAAMQKEASDALTAHAARNWGDSEKLEGIKSLGCYLLTPKPNASTWNQNKLYLVDEVSYGNTYNGANLHMKYYYYTVFTDVVVQEDGTVTWDDYDTTSHTYRFDVEGSYGYYVYGYDTLANLFKDCVTSQIDKYTYESSVAE